MKLANRTKREFSIAVMLPTRGRTFALTRSIMSLVNRAHDLANIEFIIGFDNDDTVGFDHWEKSLQPLLDERNVVYTVMKFDRLGYHNLHVYYNTMCKQVDADWTVIWNDDAVMESQNWDKEIVKHTGEFKLLSFHAHKDHPYSIFPITPIEWYDALGYLSGHSLSDAWLSQMAYMINIFERIPVWVTHDRGDLTGNNLDSTFNERILLEGKPESPGDFHHKDMLNNRYNATIKLSNWLGAQGNDQTWAKEVFEGSRDPWVQLKANDPNGQMKVWHPGTFKEVNYKKNE